MAATSTAESTAADVQHMRAVVFGGSGACGLALLRQLINDEAFSAVRSVGRRSVKPLLADVDFESGRAADVFSEVLADDLNSLPAETFTVGDRSFDVAFCSLGTTLKNAGSKQRFRAIDHDLLIAVASQARAAGVPAFAYVSASGADTGSWFFYNQIKGLNERDLAAAGFPHLAIYRPALLITERSESRPGESVAQFLAPAMDLLLSKKYQSIRVETVAAAMIRTFKEGLPDGTRIYENDEMHTLN